MFAQQTVKGISTFTSHFSRKRTAFTLAEVFHPAGKSRRIAFTLAEVLITLGIIGVVAALTMPVLMAQHRKTVVETRLKKFYSTINQAVQMAEATYGDKTTWQIDNVDQFWSQYLAPYLQYTKAESVNEGEAMAVYLPDGSAFVMDIYIQKKPGDEDVDGTSSNGGHFTFYPNAKKLTETRINELGGKEWFLFGFWPGGTNSKTNNLYYHLKKGVEPYVANWDGDEDKLKNDEKYGCNNNSKYGSVYCTAVIQHNSWKIPNDYPFKF